MTGLDPPDGGRAGRARLTAARRATQREMQGNVQGEVQGEAQGEGRRESAPAHAAWPDATARERLPRLDVRPLLAAGEDPLARILALVDELAQAGDGRVAFLLEAPFDPAPLRALLARRGLAGQARQLGPRHWQVRFTPAPAPPASVTLAEHGARAWHDDDGRHLDVRGLEAPQPMLAVLATIERCAPGETLVVHHDRVPLLLFPELAERGWAAEQLDGEGDEVRLRLTRPATAA